MAESTWLWLLLALNLLNLLVDYISYFLLSRWEINWHCPFHLHWVKSLLVDYILKIQVLVVAVWIESTKAIILTDILLVEGKLIEIHVFLFDFCSSPGHAHNHNIVKHLNGLSVSNNEGASYTLCVLFDFFSKLFPPHIPFRAAIVDKFDTPGTNWSTKLHLEIVTHLRVVVACKFLNLLLFVHRYNIIISLWLRVMSLHASWLDLIEAHSKVRFVIGKLLYWNLFILCIS